MLVQVATPQSRHLGDLIAACTSALRRGTCRVVSPQAARPSAVDAVAIVSWTDKQLVRVLIEVGTPIEGTVRWISRRIEFQPIDGVVERWRVVGLTIATLVGDLEDVQRNERIEKLAESEKTAILGDVTLTPPSTASSLSKSGAAQVRLASVRAVTFDVRDPLAWRDSWSVSGGISIAGKGPRFGTWVRSTASISRHTFTTLALSYSFRPRDRLGVFVSWVGISTGGGFEFGIPWWRAKSRLRLELLLERIGASADIPDFGGKTERFKFLPGGRGGVELEWPLGKRVGIVGGAEASLYSQPVRISVAGTQVVEFSTLAYTLFAGLRIGF